MCGKIGRAKGEAALNFLELVTEVIDLRSFSNLWYWIALAALWSTASHWVLGVPFDIVARARRGNEQANHDMHVLAEVNVNRILKFVEISGTSIVSLATFVTAALAMMGWYYDVEFCQAVFFLFFPMLMVAGLHVFTAKKIHDTQYEHLEKQLRQHRLFVQLIGVLAIFITAFWGMWANLHHGALGL